jgi:hypothetical protein
MAIQQKEEFVFEGCHAYVCQGNGKIVLCVDHSKPMALILLAGFVHMLGEPIGYCSEEVDKPDGQFLFAFNDRSQLDLAQTWKETFDKVPTDTWPIKK